MLEILKLCPMMSENLYEVLKLDKIVPIAVENCIEIISRCCALTDLQCSLIHAGVIWRLIPFLLAYDNTLKDDYTDESQRTVHNQSAANMHAIVACKALGRLGGYMFDDLQTPRNDSVRSVLGTLLTLPLAKLLRNRRPWDLLGALNENVEQTTKIWNVGMRNELLEFMHKIDNERPKGSNKDDLQLASGFVYASLKEELCIGGVYVRIFNKTSETQNIDDPSKFCNELIAYIWDRIQPGSDSGSGPDTPLSLTRRVHLDYALEALRSLAEAHNYIAHDVVNAPHGIDTIFHAISLLPPTSAGFTSAVQVLSTLTKAPEFVVAVSRYTPPCLWRLLKCLSVVQVEDVSHAWIAAENIAAHPEGLIALLQAGAVVRILGTLLAVRGYSNSYKIRLSAIGILSKFLWNPVKGGEASALLRRFIPEPVVLLLRSNVGAISLQALDQVSETPELIWTLEMQGELRQAILDLLGPIDGDSGGIDKDDDPFCRPPRLPSNYSVKYRQLMQEICVGGVYIRLYLKNPTFRLKNPVLFAEKLIEYWESAFNIQVPRLTSRSLVASNDFLNGAISSSRAVALGNEDFLSLITSCLICVVKSESSVIDHLIACGFIHTICELLSRAVTAGKRGVPMLSIVRLLHQFVVRIEVIDNLATSKVDVIQLFTECLHDADDNDKLSKDASIVVELMKKIFLCVYSKSLGLFVISAMAANLPTFLLDNILSADSSQLEHVINPSALKIHTVDLLKALLAAANETNPSSTALQLMVDCHPAFQEYKHQSHDLFITDKEKTDVYLIQDSEDRKFVGLITDGTAVDAINSYFSSADSTSDIDRNTTTDRMSIRQNGRMTLPSRVSIPTNPFLTPYDEEVAPKQTSQSPPTTPSIDHHSDEHTTPPADRTPVIAAIIPHTRKKSPVPHDKSKSIIDKEEMNRGKKDEDRTDRITAVSSGSSEAISKDTYSSYTSFEKVTQPLAMNDANTTTSSNGKHVFSTMIMKGEQGMGLDLGKTKMTWDQGRSLVLRFKDFPTGEVNPALQCSPAIHIGDVIVAVNDIPCETLSDAVKVIRSLSIGNVKLTLERSL